MMARLLRWFSPARESATEREIERWLREQGLSPWGPEA